MTKEELKEKYPQIDCEIDVREGWLAIVEDILSALVVLDTAFTVECIKEKFGGLRVYTQFIDIDREDDAWSKFQDVITKFEDKSLSVCEDCGQPGLLRRLGWMRTLCNKHSEGGKPSILRMGKTHKCIAWGTCPECKKELCSSCCLACYQCVDAYRHYTCAEKHRQETNHEGNINDLVFQLAKLDHGASEANLLHGSSFEP